MCLINFDECNIGFIGAGNMCWAFVKGLIDFGNVNPKRIFVSAPSNNNLPKFSALGCNALNLNYDLLKECSIVFLFVKYNQIDSVRDGLKHFKYENDLIFISGIAGLTLDSLETIFFYKQGFPSKFIPYRIMPNTACQVGKGVCGISCRASSHYNVSVEKFLKKIFHCKFVDENELDQWTALGGSGIAFAYMFIQAMADAGVKIGLSRKLSLEIATQTISGACEIIKQTKIHPIELRDAVCSPEGTTIYGIHDLEKSAFSSSVFDAVNSAFLRCKELKK